MDTSHLIRAHILKMDPYQPILPFDVLSEQLGIPEERIIKLDANENPYGPPPACLEQLAAMPYAHIYPDPESRHLRQALADSVQLPQEQILAGAGADELIDLILRLLIEPGDVILNCPPTFGMYAFDASLNCASVVDVPRRSNFSLDLDLLGNAIAKHKPKLVFLANPNNPDGSMLSQAQILPLLAAPTLFVIDEAYIEFAEPGSSLIQQVTEHENLIVLRTFSKWAGLAGLRVGYGAFPAALMPHLWKIKQPYNISVAASTAAMAALDAYLYLAENISAIRKERQRLYTALKTIAFLDPYPSNANFILCRVLSGTAAQIKANLASQGILVRYFDKPGLQDHIRISIGLPWQNDTLLQKLSEMEVPHAHC